MSATSAPFGFRPSYHNSGRITAKAYVIASGYAQNIFQGDPVKLTDAGTIQLATSDGTRSGTTDGIKLLGILAGCQYIGSTGRPELSPYWPASTAGTDIIAWVYDDPETIYDVMYTNPSSGTTVQTAVGEQCALNIPTPTPAPRNWLAIMPVSTSAWGLFNREEGKTDTVPSHAKTKEIPQE